MTYSSRRSDRELSAYYVKGQHTEGATEYPLDYESYTEYEGPFEFYTETTYYFTDADGVERTFQNEDEATEWLTANGYTADY